MHTLIYVLPALLVAGLLAVPSARGQETKTVRKDVKVEEFDKLRKEKDHVVLDVRTEEEFKAGHIPGPVLIDVRSSDFEKKVKELDKGKTYLVHCAAAGGR